MSDAKVAEILSESGPYVERFSAPSTVLQPARPATITPMEMLQQAIERNVSVEMLDKLMGLQERWEANEARKAYVGALTKFKANPPSVIKNKMASFGEGNRKTEYGFATIAQVCDAIIPDLGTHGLSHQWDVNQGDGGMITVSCILTHELGHSERVTLKASPDTSGSKNNIQAIGSTLSYLERYTLLAITGLAAGDMDNDAKETDKPASITAEQKDELLALLSETKSDMAKYLEYLGVSDVAEIGVKDFDKARGILVQKRDRAKKTGVTPEKKPEQTQQTAAGDAPKGRKSLLEE